MRKPICNMNRYEIIDALIEDGFIIDELEAAEISMTIHLAARAGVLLWTKDKIVSSLINRPLTLIREPL